MVKTYADDERFSPGLRDGEKYINGLKNDGRSVFIDGEKVDDVTVHPAFYQAARSIANLYDISSIDEGEKLLKRLIESNSTLAFLAKEILDK